MIEQESSRQARHPGRVRRLSAAAALSAMAVAPAAVVLADAGGAAANRPVAGATASVVPKGAVSAGGGGMAGQMLQGASPTPTGAVSAGGGGTAGSHGNPTVLLSLAGAGLLGAGGIVVARRRRALNE
ncbi:LPXTG cell wall anchor domain-containing protein, partial [Planosporangium thailandense]